MYNCARLATLFESYKCSMEQGLYPTFPPVSSLDFSLLHDEGEWLLLFNNILPFPDLLSQTAMLDCTAPGLHITARTEMVRHNQDTLYSILYSGLGHKSKEMGQ